MLVSLDALATELREMEAHLGIVADESEGAVPGLGDLIEHARSDLIAALKLLGRYEEAP
jgi:hypothetical protein